MLHDEEFYPNPNAFDPDRYTNAAADGIVNKDPRPVAFGFGRRCIFCILVSGVQNITETVL